MELPALSHALAVSVWVGSPSDGGHKDQRAVYSVIKQIMAEPTLADLQVLK